MGTKNNPGQFDCYTAADPDEPMFILLARDELAGTLVLMWGLLRLGEFEALDECTRTLKHLARRYVDNADLQKANEAAECARAMTAWIDAHRPGKLGLDHRVPSPPPTADCGGPLASIEYGEIIIRVPISALPHAAKIAFEDANYDCNEISGETRMRVNDPALFAAGIVRALNEESEDGSTPVHLLLDRAVLVAAEQGSEGLAEESR
ncbi:MAG: hypothetical protein ACK4X1_10260 [Terricaulis sp.]